MIKKTVRKHFWNNIQINQNENKKAIHASEGWIAFCFPKSATHRGVRRSFREAARVFGTGITGLTVAQRSICEILLFGYEEEKRAYVPDSRAAQLAPAMERIHAKFFKNELRIADLAALCGISEVYFRRIFHALHGKSPKEYVIDMRIERARRLLSDGSFTVREVAALCGYFEETHFSREFKRHTGCSPSDYAK